MKKIISLIILSLIPYLCFSADLTFVSHHVKYSTFEAGKWTDGHKYVLSVPIIISSKEITTCTYPISVLHITNKGEDTSVGKKSIIYKCTNSKGTKFTVTLSYNLGTNATVTMTNKNGKVTYECALADKNPAYEMVDLGLSCKWGIANYCNYSTDMKSAVFGGGKRLQYDEAIQKFGSGKRHLPSTAQINELLTRCKWEFIVNPGDKNHKCFLVTGPNGNSIFLPCNDGGNGNFSSAWYLGANAVDDFLVNALQLNVQNQIVYPFERHYYGCIRLVE